MQFVYDQQHTERIWQTLAKKLDSSESRTIMTGVVVNRENDKCFENRLVMGSAGYSYYAGLVKGQMSSLQSMASLVPLDSHEYTLSMVLCQWNYHMMRMIQIRN